MRLPGGHVRDNRDLTIVGRLRRESDALAYGRLGAIGPDHQPSGQSACARLNPNAIGAEVQCHELRGCDAATGFHQRLEQRRLQETSLDDVAEIGLARFRGVKHQSLRGSRV